MKNKKHKQHKQQKHKTEIINKRKFKEELLDMQDKRFFDDAAKEYKVPILQAALKRRPQREIYSDTIQLARDRQGLEARQQEAAVQRQAEAASSSCKTYKIAKFACC